MLKNKFKIITLIMVIMLTLMVPIVRAEDEVANNTATQENAEATSVENQENSQEETAENTENQVTSEGASTTEQQSMKEQDVYLMGDNVTIDYIVDGNLFVLANTVTIDTQVGGDIFILANTLNITSNGYIYGNVFVGAKSLTISGVASDVYAAADSITINGFIARDVHLTSNNFTLSGLVRRNAYVSSGNIEFAQNSSTLNLQIAQGTIGGNFEYSSKGEASIPDGSVSGEVKYSEEKSDSANIQTYLMSLGKFIVSAIVLWLLYLWLAPKFLEKTSVYLSKKFLPTLGYGIITPIVLVFAFAILLVLGLTSKVAVVGTLLLFALLLISSSTFVIALNNMICQKLKIDKPIGIFGMLIVTSAVIWLLALIPILGTILSYAISILGLGIIIKGILPESKKKTLDNDNSSTEKANKEPKKEKVKKEKTAKNATTEKKTKKAKDTGSDKKEDK